MQLLGCRERNLEWARKSMKRRLVPVLSYAFVADGSGLAASKPVASELPRQLFSFAVGATCWMGLRSLTPELENSLYHTQNILLCFIWIAGLEQPFSFITVFSPNQPTWKRFVPQKTGAALSMSRHQAAAVSETCRSSASWDSPGFICLVLPSKTTSVFCTL